MDKFQESLGTQMSRITGKVEALTLAFDSLSESGVKIAGEDVELVKRNLDEHGKLLRECLKFFASSLKAVHENPVGTQVRYVTAKENAMSIVGNFGPIKADAPPVMAGKVDTSGSAFSAIGNTDFTRLSPEVIKAMKGH